MNQPLESRREKIGLKEFFTLLWINTIVFFRNSIEFIRVAFRYYGNALFFKADIGLRLMYLFHNPFSISKRFLMKRGEKEIYAYGETPLTSLEIISRECQIGPQDHVFELGAGRGRGCFWLRCFTGCRVVGIEYIPEFIERANRIKKRIGITGLDFRLEDMLEANLTGATVCYLYGTCLEDKLIEQLARQFSQLPAGTKIITVSYALMEYAKDNSFETMKRFTVPFTWGEADVFLNMVK